MSTNRTAIACFGEALIDMLAWPADAGEPRRFTEQAGGAPANVAVGVARLGGDARFVGMLGRDSFGDFLLAQLLRYGVNVGQVRRTAAARTALAFVSLDARGERSFDFYRPPAADLLFTDADFDRDAMADCAVFHVCSNSLTAAEIAATTLHGMRLAAQAGAIISMDLNLRPALWPGGIAVLPTAWEALELAHLVKLSRDELAFIAAGGSGHDAIQRLLARRAEVVMVTDGASPVYWSTRTGSGTAPTFPVEVVDSTAAGDAFVAGLLHGIVERGIRAEDLGAAFDDPALRGAWLAQAAAAGACATMRHGAFAAMPDRAAIDALIRGG